MSKPKLQRKLGKKQVLAVGRSLRVSPRKLNLVAQFIRGMYTQDALVQLEFLNKRIAKDVRKVVQSAIANAENNHGLNIDSLFVKEAIVGKAMVMKRFQPRARGRASGILKPFSTIRLVLEEKE